MKIYERIVKSTFEPNKNDLWLKPGEGGSITMYEYNGGEWLPIGGSGLSGGSGSSCDCDTSDFIRLSELNVTFPCPSQEDLVYIEDFGGEAVFIEDNNVEKRMLLASAGLLRSIRFIRGNEMSDLVLNYDNYGHFVNRNNEWMLYPADVLPPSALAQLNVPEDSTGWVLTHNSTETS